MKPLDSIETPETRLGRAGDTACLTRRLPASESGAPFPLLPCQPPGKDAAVRRRLMTGTSTYTGYFDGALATPPGAEAMPQSQQCRGANQR